MSLLTNTLRNKHKKKKDWGHRNLIRKSATFQPEGEQNNLSTDRISNSNEKVKVFAEKS